MKSYVSAVFVSVCLIPILFLTSCAGILATKDSAPASTLVLAPTSLSFGPQPVGTTSAAQIITLQNSGTTPITVQSLATTSGQFSLQSPPALPLSLPPGGQASVRISFSPTASTSFTGTLKVSALGWSTPYSAALSGSGQTASNGGGVLTIATASLKAGTVGQSYSTQLQSTGGQAPYTWQVATGALPPGITLDPSTGQLSGTPSSAGTFTLTVKVSDSTQPTPLTASVTLNLVVSSTSLDAYGGNTQLPCSTGAAPHFYTAKVNGRWTLCTPAGNSFWLKSVYHADASDSGADYQGITENGVACTPGVPASASSPCSVIVQKYGDNNIKWGPQTIRRLKSWGFNALAEYASAYVLPVTTNSAWSTTDHSNPEKMPFTGLFWPAHYSRLTNSYAQPVKDLIAPMKASTFTGYRHPSADFWDPNFATYVQANLADPTNPVYQWTHSPHSDFLIGLNVDDTDELLGLGAGPDFPTLSNGNLDSGTGRQEPHLGWMILVTPPTQASGVDANGRAISYQDTKVYSKLALGNWLSSRYNGSISALNSAWGSNYTTFDSAGGWGTGTGLLDEDGSHAWVPTDSNQLNGATAAMKKDLDDFLAAHVDHYFSLIRSALKSAAPGILYLGPTALGAWGAPPRRQILQVAAVYVDVLSISTTPTTCLSCTDDQARIDFLSQYGGDKPWTIWEGFFAQPDSYMSSYPAPDSSSPQTSTQNARGQLFQSMMTGLLAAKDTATSTFHIVGYKWWELYDNRSEQANWGLLTRRDNAYDGVEAVPAAHVDAWGLPTGGEMRSYGDFLSSVTQANNSVYPQLQNLP